MEELPIFDTHCHLADKKYEGQDIKEIIKEAKNVGVKYILNVGYDKESNKKLIEHLKEFSNLFAALGLHPNDAKNDLVEENLKWIESQLNNKKVIAIGEIGLDYYYDSADNENVTIQKIWFKKQLTLAKKYNLPVLLHIRNKIGTQDAFNDAYQILKQAKVTKGVLHCFTGTWEIAQKFMNLGEFYISFAGNINYVNKQWKERWQELIEKMPLDRIVVETDAPYLSPIPWQKEKNYPKNIIYTLKKIAEVKKTEVSKIQKAAYHNTFRKLFNLT